MQKLKAVTSCGLGRWVSVYALISVIVEANSITDIRLLLKGGPIDL